MLCGDIELNPGTSETRSQTGTGNVVEEFIENARQEDNFTVNNNTVWSYEDELCILCNKKVEYGEDGMLCENTSCNKWFHRECINMSEAEYSVYNTIRSNTPWECHACSVIRHHINFSNNEMDDHINISDTDDHVSIQNTEAVSNEDNFEDGSNQENKKKGEPWGSALFVANRMLPGSIPTLPLKAL